MSRKLLLGFALLLLLGAGVAQADAKFELAPFVGYRSGDKIDDLNRLLVKELETEDDYSWGVLFDVNFGEHVQLEFLFSRQETDLVEKFVAGGKSRLSDIDVDNYHVGGVYRFGDSLDDVRPFVSFYLGSTYFRPDGLSSESKFSFSFGGGAKFYFAERLGLMLMGRWTPTYINSSAGGYFCGPIYGCWVVSDSQYFDQFEASVGLIIRFGSQ
jgi:hypothetical protein